MNWMPMKVPKSIAIQIMCLFSAASVSVGQITKLLPPENSSDRRFGSSVFIGNDLIIVGATEDYLTDPTGAVYVFDRVSETLIRELVPADGKVPCGFGGKVELDNGVIVVSAALSEANGQNSGCVYLFSAENGEQMFRLVPQDNVLDDWFGASIAIGGGIVAAGAIYDDDNGSQSGSVSLFDASNGAQLAKLLPMDGGPGDTFGEMMAIDNGLLAISAQLDSDNGFRSGSAYLFDLSTGMQLRKLLASDGQAEDRFGFSLDMQGGLIAVGAYYDDDNGNDSGSAYIFDAVTGEQISKLVPKDGAPKDVFAFRLSIRNGLVAVGAPGDDDQGEDSGSVYLFDAMTGTQLAKLTASDGEAGDAFGRSVDLGPGGLIVGAWFDDDRGVDSGSAYVFDTSAYQERAP
jgi:hypothetical protein